MGKRTVRDFKVAGDFWPTVDKWAKDTNFTPKESTATKRLYQKGHGMLVAPMMMEIRKTDLGLHLEAWITANLFVRLMALFILPSEMGIESGGIRGIVPRRIARTDVNKLLNIINQPPIP